MSADGAILCLAQCIDDPQPRDSVYNVNQNLCSSGFEVNVHSTPCQASDKLLFTIKRKSVSVDLLCVSLC